MVEQQNSGSPVFYVFYAHRRTPRQRSGPLSNSLEPSLSDTGNTNDTIFSWATANFSLFREMEASQNNTLMEYYFAECIDRACRGAKIIHRRRRGRDFAQTDRWSNAEVGKYM